MTLIRLRLQAGGTVFNVKSVGLSSPFTSPLVLFNCLSVAFVSPNCNGSYSTEMRLKSYDQADNLFRIRSEPPMRGTFRLLISCIVTLSLCVYTALHLNLPSPGSSTSAVYMKKTWWVFLGILAPELVVYTAWGQWNSARKLTTRIKEILQEQV